MSACEKHSANILLYLDRNLSGHALEDFLAHLGTCADCRKQLEEEEALSSLFQRSRPLYIAPDALRARAASILARQPVIDDASYRSDGSILRAIPSSMRRSQHAAFRLGALAAMILIVIVGLTFVPTVVRHADAATFIDTAVTAHRGYLDNQLPLEIRSSSPEVVTAWVAGKVPFQFRLPAHESSPNWHPAYILTGARLVTYKHKNAALVTYQMETETISLLVTSDQSALALGGDEIRSGGLTFHYTTKAGFNVITWTTHGLTYALVSSTRGSARHSCLVCHQNMADKNDFK